MKNPEWNKLRARLHHDWLQNRYLTFLRARAEYLDAAVMEKAQIRTDLLEQFLEWHNKESAFEALIEEAKEALSPAQIVDEYPLNRMSEEDKAWLKELVHALYVERTGMKKTAESLREKFSVISELYSFLLRILKGGNDNSPLPPLKLRGGGEEFQAGERPFKKFYNELQEFSRMISALPQEVQVI